MDVIATRYIDESLLNAMDATSINSIQAGDYRSVTHTTHIHISTHPHLPRFSPPHWIGSRLDGSPSSSLSPILLPPLAALTHA